MRRTLWLVTLAACTCDDPTRLAVILLNRSVDERLDADVLLSPGSGRITELAAWRFDEHGPDLRRVRSGPVAEGESFRDTLPPLSATLYVVRLESPFAAR